MYNAAFSVPIITEDIGRAAAAAAILSSMELCTVLVVLVLVLAVAVPVIMAALMRLKRFQSQKLAGSRCWPVVGMLPGLLHNFGRLHEWIVELLERSGGTFQFRAPGLGFIITANAANLEHVLRTNFRNYVKGELFAEALHDFLGDSMLIQDGERFQRLTAVASVALSSEGFRAAAEAATVDTLRDNLFRALDAAAKHGKKVDLQEQMELFTLFIIARAGLGVDPAAAFSGGGGTALFVRMFDEALQLSTLRLFVPAALWRAMRLLRVGPERRLHQSIAKVRERIAAMVEMRRRELRFSSDDLGRGCPMDGLSVMSIIDTTTTWDDEALATMGISILVAGKDTLAVALTWFFLALHHNPEVHRNILQELENILSHRKNKSNEDAQGAAVVFETEEVQQMHYLQASLSESLRLYPAVPLNVVQAAARDVLPDGTFVPAKTVVLYSSQALGRSEAVWGRDSKIFRPERWILRSGRCGSFPENKFLAFNAGPRRCQGRQFAFRVMKAAAASMIVRYNLSISCDDAAASAVPKLSLATPMLHGLPVHVSLRHRHPSSS